MSTPTSAPVIASKPVANTIASNSKSSADVVIPVSVIVSIGVRRRLTSRTCGELYVA